MTEAGDDGPGFLDYCEAVSLVLASKRVILVYRDGTADYLWLYGPEESSGKYDSPGGRWLSGRLELHVTWTTTDITAAVARDGIDIATVTNTLDPAAVDAEASIRVGLRCYGTTPSSTVHVDDVEILTPP